VSESDECCVCGDDYVFPCCEIAKTHVIQSSARECREGNSLESFANGTDASSRWCLASTTTLLGSGHGTHDKRSVVIGA
jgi:hypothetical protein